MELAGIGAVVDASADSEGLAPSATAKVEIAAREPFAFPARIVEFLQRCQADAADKLIPRTPTLLDILGDVVGSVEGLPEDASRNVDHYLYGHPKQ